MRNTLGTPFDMADTAHIMNLSSYQAVELNNFLRDNMDRLIGQIMQATEVLGLPDKQEESFKNTLKDVVYKRWDWFTEAVNLMTEDCAKCRTCLNGQLPCSTELHKGDQWIAKMTVLDMNKQETNERLVQWLRDKADNLEISSENYDDITHFRLMK